MKVNGTAARLAIALIAVLMLTSITFIPRSQGQEEASEAPPALDKTETINIKVEFSAPQITAVRGYHRVGMEGLPNFGKPGEPELPIRPVRMLIPFGNEVVEVRVSHGREVALDGFYTVEPAQKPVPLSSEAPVEFTPPDEEIYNCSTPFPARIYSDSFPQSKRGYKILILSLYPVSYVPSEGELSYFEEMTVEVEFRPAPPRGLSVKCSNEDRREIMRMVDNPEAIDSYPLELGSLGGESEHEYVIITSENLKNYSGDYDWQTLCDRKESRGVTTKIENLDSIYTNYDGVDNAEKVRNFIKDAYDNWGTKYVLLGGDDTVVPFRKFWVGEEIPSDMYYSCLDGTFNYDKDSLWGEPNDGPDGGEVDLYAEVYVGRAPVASGTDVSNFVRKTLAFEDFVPEDKYLAYMVGEKLGGGGPLEYAKESKEEVRLGSDNHGYTTAGFASCDFVETSTLYDYYGFWWSKYDLIDIINNGVWTLNHLAHAAKDEVMKLHTSYLYSLTNTEYFFAYSQGCNAGHFDGGADCWAEKVVRMEHGAAAVVMNARKGWGRPNSTDGASQHFDREFWDAVFGENIYEMGRANADSKEDQYWYITSNSNGRYCAYELNLFGDPELRFVNLLVAAIISPGENSGLPSSTLEYKVLVWNGDREDNYILTASDIEDWDLALSKDLLEDMQPYEVREITLSATIPDDVDPGTDDEITVVVTSQENAEISDNAVCKARVPPSRRVEVSIVPSENLGCHDKWPDITFEITIKNTGIENDNYDLNVDDNAGWDLTLSENLLENMPYNENRAVTLTVTIPDGTESGTVDNVTVTAVSQGDSSVSDNASCLARAGTRVIEDNFEDYEVGEFPSAGGWRTVWSGTGQNYVVDDVSVSGSKSFQLQGKSNESAVIGEPLDFFAWKVGTWIGYEAYVRAEDIGGGEKLSAVLGFFIQTAETSGKFFACVNFKDDGTIESGGEVLGSFSADTWYKIRVMLDTSTDLYDVWIDGEQVGEGLETRDSHLIKSFAFCSSFALSSDRAGIKIYYDDVKVFLPPGKPVLASPNNGQILTDKTPTFTWTEGSNADNHRIEVDNDPNFSSIIDNVTVTENTWTKPSPEYAPGTYYWRVWAVNAGGENCSETWEFRITHVVIENISGYMEKEDYFYPPTTENKFLGAGKLEYVGQRLIPSLPPTFYYLVDNYSPLDWNVYPVENTHVQSVKTSDGDNTYIYTSTEDKIDLFEVDNIAPDRWIKNVIVCAIVMRPGGTSGTAYLALQTYGTNYFSTSKDVENKLTYISAVWTTNPYTNENWTKAEVDNLKVGIKSGATDNEIRCTYIYIIVFWKNYFQRRGFISFDTSSIPDDATVKSAKLYLAMQYDYSSTDFDVYFYSGENQWTGTDNLSWEDCPDNQGIFFNTSEKTTNTYYSQTVAPSAISKTGRTQFRLTSSREESSIEPTGVEFIGFYVYDNPDYGPYLEVIFSPGKPVLVSPENDARSSNNTPTFIWAWAPNADNYRIEVDNNPDFSSVIDNVPVTENTWTKGGDGYAAGTYYWRVWAVNVGGENCSENTWQFTIWAANFSLVNLYTVNVDKTLDLYRGSKLVVKFYTYGDAFENENVIENFSTLPWHVEENEHARHPGIGGERKGVKKARLDLTTDDTENVIETIASFTVRRVDLEARFMDIPFYWSQADPAGKLELEAEFMEIPFYWSGAPSSVGPLGLGFPISDPSGENIKVAQGDNFLIRHTLEWNEPENGAYTVTLYWDCYDNHENENFTFLGAEAYFDLDNDNLPDPGLDPILAVVELDSAPSPDYPGSTRYLLSVSCPVENKDNRNGQFNVDITLSASGAGGVPHVPGDHVIPWHFAGFGIVEKYPQSWYRDAINIKVLGRSVSVSISPSYDGAKYGQNITFSVMVTNTGDDNDNFTLTVDNQWAAVLSDNKTSQLSPLESENFTLAVTVPASAKRGDNDKITVTATSQADNTVSDNYYCTAVCGWLQYDVHGEKTAYNIDLECQEPWRSYPKGSLPPIMASKSFITFFPRPLKIGRVVAAGFASTCADNQWSENENFHVLVDNIFNWLVRGYRTTNNKVLWYTGHGVHYDNERCSQLIDNLNALGWNITADNFEPITTGELENYDIVVIPQLREGDTCTGGDPTQLLDSEVDNLENFVKGADKRGLLVLESSDYGGYNYNRVQNKILVRFSFPVYFQNDEVVDYTSNWGSHYKPVVWVYDTGYNSIGDYYQAATGDNEVGLYRVCSLAESADNGAIVSIYPKTKSGDNGENLTFNVIVTNSGKDTDNFAIEVVENEWACSLSSSNIDNLGSWQTDNSVTLTVTVPSDASYGDSDKITVKATSQSDPTVSDNYYCTAVCVT